MKNLSVVDMACSSGRRRTHVLAPASSTCDWRSSAQAASPQYKRMNGRSDLATTSCARCRTKVHAGTDSGTVLEVLRQR